MMEGVVYILLPVLVITVIFIVTEALFGLFNIILGWIRG